ASEWPERSHALVPSLGIRCDPVRADRTPRLCAQFNFSSPLTLLSNRLAAGGHRLRPGRLRGIDGRHVGRHVRRQRICRRDSTRTIDHYGYFDCSWDNENGEHSDQRELISASRPKLSSGRFSKSPTTQNPLIASATAFDKLALPDSR